VPNKNKDLDAANHHYEESLLKMEFPIRWPIKTVKWMMFGFYCGTFIARSRWPELKIGS